MKCPNCDGKINPETIRVRDSLADELLLDLIVTCPHCKMRSGALIRTDKEFLLLGKPDSKKEEVKP